MADHRTRRHLPADSVHQEQRQARVAAAQAARPTRPGRPDIAGAITPAEKAAALRTRAGRPTA